MTMLFGFMSKELDKELGGAKMKLNYKDKFQPFFY
jgi:hypothetical protein